MANVSTLANASTLVSPSWFNQKDYIQSKLVQLQYLDNDKYGKWTEDQVESALTSAFGTVYAHYQAYGASEFTTPSRYFQAEEYFLAKVNQLNEIKHNGRSDWNVADVKAAFKDAGLSAWAHYQKFGWEEGVNPSNSFDTQAYLEAKAAQLNEVKHEGKTGWTVEKVVAAFKAAGVDPVSHYFMAGQAEKIAVPAVAPQAQVASAGAQVVKVGSNTDKPYEGFDGVNTVFSSVLVSDENGHGVTSLNSAHILDGGAGVNALHVQLRGASSPRPTLKNVQVVQVQIDEASDGLGLDLARAQGVQKLILTDSINNTSFDNVGKISHFVLSRKVGADGQAVDKTDTFNQLETARASFVFEHTQYKSDKGVVLKAKQRDGEDVLSLSTLEVDVLASQAKFAGGLSALKELNVNVLAGDSTLALGKVGDKLNQLEKLSINAKKGGGSLR